MKLTPMGIDEADLCLRSALYDSRLSQSGGDELAGVLQCKTTALAAGLCQSDAISEKLACRTGKTLCLNALAMGFVIRGQGQLFAACE